MAKDITVTFQDGSQHVYQGVPDEVTGDQAEARAHADFPDKALTSLAREAPGAWGTVKRAAEVGGSAILRGLMSIPAMAAEAGMALDPGRYPTRNSALRDVSELGVQPTTTGEKYAARGLEGAAGALAGPGVIAAPLRSALVGASSGLGGEVSANLLGDNVLSRLLGGLAGGGAASLASAAKTTRAELAQEAMRDAGEAGLREGQAAQRNALKEGVSLILPQGMGRGSNLDEMMNSLASSPHGVETARILRNQPKDVALMVEREVGGLPGIAREPQVAANNVQEAATGALDSLKGQRTRMWQDTFDQVANRTGAGANVPQSAVMAEVARLRGLAAGDLQNTPKGQALNRLANSMLDDLGVPITSATNLNEVLKAAGAKLKGINLETPGIDAGAVRFIQSQIAQSRDNFGKAFEPIQAANQAYRSFTEGVYNPVKQSVVGRVAGKGFDPAQEAAQSRVFGVLDRGTTPGASTSEILTLEKALRRQPNGPESFQDAIKTWMANKVAESSTQQGGRASEDVAANLEKVFLGNEVKAQGTKDMLVALARSQGLPDNALLPGMQNVLRIASAAARRPSPVAGVTPSGLEEASRSATLGRLGNFSFIQPFRLVSKGINDALHADAYGFMDKMMSTPEGVDMLIRLGKQPVMSKAAVDTLATFLATTANAQNPSQTQVGGQ
jgi:hypothetical protein